MLPQWIKTIIFFIIVFAVLGIIHTVSNAGSVLLTVDPFFFILSAILYLISIFFWILSLSYLTKKELPSVSMKELIVLGWSCIFGTLTPLQVGTEAMRAIQFKRYYEMSYFKALFIGLFVKAAKFFEITILGVILLAYFLSTGILEPIFLLLYFSGLIMMLLVSLAFLLPFFPIGAKFVENVSNYFLKLWKKLNQFSGFFVEYSVFIRTWTLKDILHTFFLGAISWGFEFLSVIVAFSAVHISADLGFLIFLYVSLAIVERVPFIPRGIGAVELVAFNILLLYSSSINNFSIPQIGAFLIIYDVIRLAIPTLSGMAAYFLFQPTHKQQDKQTI